MTKENSATKSRQERSEKKLERDLSDIRAVSKTPEGRRFMWRILSRSGVFRTNGCSDAIQMAKVEGMREYGIELLNDIMHAKSSLFSQLQQEHASEKKRELIEIESETEKSDPLSLN